MKRRFLSALLALCLMLSLMPTAWASGGTADPPTNGSCGANVEWILGDDGKLTIFATSGTGEMAPPNPSWSGSASKITAIEILSGVTSIHDSAFSALSNLTQITIPSSVVTVGKSPLVGCSKLTNIYFNGTTAQWDAIKTQVMDNLSGNISVRVQEEETRTSGTCGDGTNWTFADGTLSIYGSGVIDITKGDSWQHLRGQIKHIQIDAGVKGIGAGAFAGFTVLVDIMIPDTVKEAGSGAFSNCPKLETVYYTGSSQEWNQITGDGMAIFPNSGIKVITDYKPLVITFTPGKGSINGSGGNVTRETLAGSPLVLIEKPKRFLPEKNNDGSEKAFAGWLIGDVVYPVGYAYAFTENTTVEAWWDIPTTAKYTITNDNVYDGVRITDETPTTLAEYSRSDQKQAIRVPTPHKDGYIFLGWTSPRDKTLRQELIIPAGETGDLTYTANWEGAAKNILVFDDKDDIYREVDIKVAPKKQTVTVEVPVADGMTWKIESYTEYDPESPPDPLDAVYVTQPTPDQPGTATVYIPADHLSDILLYGEFEPNTYDIIWDANGGVWGSNGEETQTKENAYTFDADTDDASSVKVPTDTVTRTGYDLDGWTCDNDKVSIKWDDIKKEYIITIGKGTFGDLTISAQWKVHEYDVIWKGAGGTWGQDADGNEITEKEGTTYNIETESLTQTPPTQEGWTFTGWKGELTKADNTKVEVVSSEEDPNTVLLPEDLADCLGNLELEAQWKKEYTIKFNPGEGGTGEMADDTALEEDEYPLPDCGFTPPASKQFAGWEINGKKYPLFVEDTTDPDNPTTKRNTYTIPSYISGDAEITLTALWEDIKYTVTYVADNGTEEPNHTVPVVHGQEHTLLAPSDCGFTTPEGKKFLHWKVEGQTRKYQPGDKLPNTLGNLNVTAVWGDEAYTVTFDGNGGSGTMAPVEGLTFNQSYTLPECGFTPPAAPPDPNDPDAELPEYVFVAWEIGGQEYLPRAAVTITKSITAKAVWVNKADLVEYTLTYAPGGGTGEMEADTFYVRQTGVSVAVPLPSASEFLFADMEFDGWQVNGVDYQPGQSAPISGDATATALWRGKIVYVNGGNVTEPSSYRYSDSSQQLEMNVATPVKPGFIFEKWTWDNEDVALYGHIIDLPGKFSGTLTLTGHWVEDEGKYLVIFDPNGGTGEMSPVAVDKATEEGAVTEYELPACAFTPPEGMEFDGWSVEGTKYPAGGKIILTASKTTVKAEWKKKDVDPDAEDCVVTYLPGEGTGEAIVEEGHKVGEWLTLPECTFTAPEGMEFDAWQKGEQKAAPGEEVYLDSEAVTITALWKEKEPEPDDPTKPWTITFDANGGTGAMDPVTVPKAEGGTTYTLPACGFTAPEGKTFQAWKFDGKEYAPGAVITITGDTTITAVWKDAEVKPPKPTSWKITYNLNGGYMTGSGPTSYNLSDQAQTLNVPVPYKSGFTFLGWTYSGVSKPTKSVVIRANMTGDLTVVANWQMNPGAGGGNNTSQGYYISVSATAGGEIIIPWEYANQGAVVSVQARPQPGYEVGGVTVVNSQGFEVGDLKDLGGGNYSFTMPGYRVNVSATFKLQSAAVGPITRPVMNYEDVRLGDWFYDSVEYVYTRGMMSGVSATQFGPYGQATRGAIWTALAAHAGFDINGGATWYERGQYWAVNRGITDGESPSGTITREQLVTMLWRYKGSPVVFGGDLWQFTDGYAVSSYAMDAMRWAVSTGLIGGANGRLSPQASTTRAEAAAILARFCQS